MPILSITEDPIATFDPSHLAVTFNEYPGGEIGIVDEPTGDELILTASEVAAFKAFDTGIASRDRFMDDAPFTDGE